MTIRMIHRMLMALYALVAGPANYGSGRECTTTSVCVGRVNAT
jgi:hypothetical protein